MKKLYPSFSPRCGNFFASSKRSEFCFNTQFYKKSITVFALAMMSSDLRMVSTRSAAYKNKDMILLPLLSNRAGPTKGQYSNRKTGWGNLAFRVT